MRTTKRRWIGALALLASLPTVAAKGTQKLYITARDTHVMASPSVLADTVVTLQPGDEVIWQGKAPKPPWHKIQRGKQVGYVLQACLATKPPAMDIVGTEKAGTVDAHAFASAGAATRALTEGAKKYGEKKSFQDALRKLQMVEAAANRVQPEQINRFARKQGLNPVVGGSP